VILPGFTLERREDGSLLQLARLALIVAAPGRCGGLRGRFARRRRRGPEGLRAAGGARRAPFSPQGPRRTGKSCAASGLASSSSSRGAYPGAVVSRVRRASRALEDVRDIHHRFPAAPGGTRCGGIEEQRRRRGSRRHNCLTRPIVARTPGSILRALNEPSNRAGRGLDTGSDCQRYLDLVEDGLLAARSDAVLVATPDDPGRRRSWSSRCSSRISSWPGLSEGAVCPAQQVLP
jgi:hypothetical protein